MIKKLVILRGLPGSFKSTLANSLKEDNAVIFSTDNFYMVNGEYKFTPELIKDAHTWNKLNALKAMFSSYPLVVIDNTNTTWWEVEEYVKMGLKYGYEIEFLEPNNPERFNVDLCFERNTHNVPKEVIQKMKDRWESTESLYQKLEQLRKEND